MSTPTIPFKYMPSPLFTDPYADEWTAPFWEATKREQLTAPKCTNCGTFRLPPSRWCATCHQQSLEYVDLPGTGTLYSFIIVRHPLTPDQADYVPYLPAVVDADGAPGCRFVSNIVDVEPEDVKVGMLVKVVWNKVSDTLTLPFWTAA